MQKLILKLIIPVFVFLYQSTGGRLAGSINGIQVLLLTTNGRKTGKRRTLPVSYIRVASSYVVAASNGGRDQHPGWFFNARGNPEVIIQVKDQRQRARAEIAGPEKRGELWAQLVKTAPFFARYQQVAHREIPIVILHPTENTSME